MGEISGEVQMPCVDCRVEQQKSGLCQISFSDGALLPLYECIVSSGGASTKVINTNCTYLHTHTHTQTHIHKNKTNVLNTICNSRLLSLPKRRMWNILCHIVYLTVIHSVCECALIEVMKFGRLSPASKTYSNRTDTQGSASCEGKWKLSK